MKMDFLLLHENFTIYCSVLKQPDMNVIYQFLSDKTGKILLNHATHKKASKEYEVIVTKLMMGKQNLSSISLDWWDWNRGVQGFLCWPHEAESVYIRFWHNLLIIIRLFLYYTLVKISTKFTPFCVHFLRNLKLFYSNYN